jgi:hypothetical protein
MKLSLIQEKEIFVLFCNFSPLVQTHGDICHYIFNIIYHLLCPQRNAVWNMLCKNAEAFF